MSDKFVNNENKIDIVHKELELIQNTINRMANNSFMIKGWCITLFAGLITLFQVSKLSDLILGLSLIVIVFLFCYLDAFFIWTERKYRALYNDVIQKRTQNNYSELYSLNTKPYEKETVFDVIFNKKHAVPENSERLVDSQNKKEQKRNTLVLFYLPMIIVSVVFILISPFVNNKKTETVKCEFSTVEMKTELDDLSTKIEFLKSQSEEISTKSISLANNITSEKETLDSIHNQLTVINTELTQLLPLLKQTEINNNTDLSKNE